MAHAYQSTLLAKLGGADPDRHLPEHDLIGMYIADHADVFVERLELPFRLGWNFEMRVTPVLEKLLTTRTGFAIGFIDVTLEVKCKYERDRVVMAPKERFYCRDYDSRNVNLCTNWRKEGFEQLTDDEHCHKVHEIEADSFDVAIEVKVCFPSIGDVLRQINLYREHCSASAWVLVTPQLLRASDISALRRAEIQYVRIGGDRFEQWLAKQGNAP